MVDVELVAVVGLIRPVKLLAHFSACFFQVVSIIFAILKILFIGGAVRRRRYRRLQQKAIISDF